MIQLLCFKLNHFHDISRCGISEMIRVKLTTCWQSDKTKRRVLCVHVQQTVLVLEREIHFI